MNTKTFGTNLFCLLSSGATEKSIGFGESEARFINRGKTARLTPRSSATCSNDSEDNIFELVILSCDLNQALHIVDLIGASKAIIEGNLTVDLESIRKNILLSTGNPLSYYYGFRIDETPLAVYEPSSLLWRAVDMASLLLLTSNDRK